LYLNENQLPVRAIKAYDINSSKQMSISVFVSKNIFNFTRPLYFDNLTRSISVFVPKDIINYTTSSYQKPKVFLET
jgi:hypothetical protein